jgi:hypothetical protein
MTVRGAIIVAGKRVPRIDRRPAHTLRGHKRGLRDPSPALLANRHIRPHPPAARSTPGAHTAAPILVSGDTVLNEKSAAPVFGNQHAIAQRSLPVLPVRPVQPAPTHPSPSAHAQRSLPVLPVRPVQPAPTHPSPSAHEFRLLLNELAKSELRRMAWPFSHPAVSLEPGRTRAPSAGRRVIRTHPQP